MYLTKHAEEEPARSFYHRIDEHSLFRNGVAQQICVGGRLLLEKLAENNLLRAIANSRDGAYSIFYPCLKSRTAPISQTYAGQFIRSLILR